MAAAHRFFAQALDAAGHAPAPVTTDGHDAYPRAIREALGDGVAHRTSRDKNHRIEPDHRGAFAAAARFRSDSRDCAGTSGPSARAARVTLAGRRQQFQERWKTAMAELTAV